MASRRSPVRSSRTAGRHAVAGGEPALAAQDDVGLGVATGEQDLLGDGLEGRLDDVPGELGGELLAVDFGAGGFEDVDRLGRVVGDADLGEDLEDLLVDERLFVSDRYWIRARATVTSLRLSRSSGGLAVSVLTGTRCDRRVVCVGQR